MQHTLDQLQPLFRAIMEKISDDGGFFLKPDIFTLKPFEPERGMDVEDALPLRVATGTHPRAQAQAVNLSQEVESLFMKHLERIAKRDGLEMECPEEVWMVAAKDAETLKVAMQTLAKELGVDARNHTPGRGK